MHALTIIVRVVGIVFSILFAGIPFTGKRTRAPWAKPGFVITGLLGVISSLGYWMLDADLPIFHGQRAHMLATVALAQMSGLCLGFIFSLIFSGQLCGSKQPLGEGPPAAPLNPTVGPTSPGQPH